MFLPFLKILIILTAIQDTEPMKIPLKYCTIKVNIRIFNWHTLIARQIALDEAALV